MRRANKKAEEEEEEERDTHLRRRSVATRAAESATSSAAANSTASDSSACVTLTAVRQACSVLACLSLIREMNLDAAILPLPSRPSRTILTAMRMPWKAVCSGPATWKSSSLACRSLRRASESRAETFSFASHSLASSAVALV
mgnify:CR=1 FL=1